MKKLISLCLCLILLGCEDEMKVVKPIEITDSNMTSSISEPSPGYDPPEFNERGPYDDSVIDSINKLTAIPDGWLTYVVDATLGNGLYEFNDQFYTYTKRRSVDFSGIAYDGAENYWLNESGTITEYRLRNDSATGRTITASGGSIAWVNTMIALYVGGGTQEIRFYRPDGALVPELTFNVPPTSAITDIDSDGVNIYMIDTTTRSILIYSIDGTDTGNSFNYQLGTGYQSSLSMGINDTHIRFNSLDNDDRMFIVNLGDLLLDPQWQPGWRVYLESTHNTYECVIVTDVSPDIGVDDFPASWVVYGSTNKWSMFDGVIGTQSKQLSSSTFEVMLTPAGGDPTVNSIAVFNISDNIDSVQIEVEIDSEIVYDETISTRSRSNVKDWWTYFFSPLLKADRLGAFNVPGYPGSTITVTFDTEEITTVEMSVGELVFGSLVDIGVTEYGTSWQLLDFNQRQRDDFGNFTVTTGRRTADLFNYNLYFRESQFDYVRQQLSQLTGIPCVWTGSTESDTTLSYGYYSNITSNFTTYGFCDATIKVEGLI